MEILEAYRHTLDVAGDLRVSGIKTEITQSRSNHDQEENGLPKSMWVQIIFHPTKQAQVDAINQTLDELGWACIVFDTSGHPGQRQWDVDWSFAVLDAPDGEWEARRKEVEGMIDGMGGDGAAEDRR